MHDHLDNRVADAYPPPADSTAAHDAALSALAREVEGAHGAPPQVPGGRMRFLRGWRRPARLVPVASVAVVAAVAIAVLIDTSGGSGSSLVQRAQAAVTPEGEIVHIVSTYRADGEEVQMYDWSLVDADGAVRMRRVVTSGLRGPVPDDEDTVVTLDADGGIRSAASWSPGGGREEGNLQLGWGPEDVPWANTWAGMLSAAYRDGRLAPTGAVEDGLMLLEGNTGLMGSSSDTPDGCEPLDRVALDPDTFEPRRLDLTIRCGERRETVGRIEMSVRRLPATPANLERLEMGPWPVTTAERIDPATGASRPVGVAEARRAAGMD